MQNIFIVSSSINHGFNKTFVFISGATIGFTLLLVFIGLGFITILTQYPLFLQFLSVLGALFIIYMGYKIISSSSSLDIQKQDMKKLRFYEGFLLQWLNPKAWIASVSGVAVYSNTQEILYTFIAVYFVMCYVSLTFWGIVGIHAAKLLNTNKRLKIFNVAMGCLLMLSACYLLISFLKLY